MKASHTLIILLFCLVSPLSADWDYKYLALDDLMDTSSLIVVAEIKAIEEKIEAGKVTQQIVFSPITPLKGESEPNGFTYYASYVPQLCKMPKSHYIDSPPGTKFLLFLRKEADFYVSVLGPCGALRVSDYLTERVFWYTDESKAQRFGDHWKERPLKEAVARIKKKAEQD